MQNASETFEMVYGDVDISYGGLWIKDCGEYGDVVEVTDLDSATGTRNMVMVAVGSVGLYGRTLSDNRQRLETAVQSGIGREAFVKFSGSHRRLAGWAALWEYGYRDIDQESIIATDPHDWDGGSDQWKPTERSFGPDRVNGTPGLKRWLARYCDIAE